MKRSVKGGSADAAASESLLSKAGDDLPEGKKTVYAASVPRASRVVRHAVAWRSKRDGGGAPRSLAPRSHFWVWIVKPSGCHCTDGHLAGRVFTED